MTEEPRRLIEIGTLPSGYDSTFVSEGGVDPVAVMLRAAEQKLDAERAAEAKALAAKADDAERLRRTKEARVMRRLGKALRAAGYYMRLR
jgi:hypothetical protein